MKQKLILVADSDKAIRRSVRLAFSNSCYRVLEVDKGEKVLELLKKSPCALLILDVKLAWDRKDNGSSGLQLCKYIRERSDIPIMLLAEEGPVKEEIEGLEAGADAYVRKPFDLMGLWARVKAVLRRTSSIIGSLQQIIDYPMLHINVKDNQVIVADREIHLTSMEQRLFTYLAMNPNKTFSRNELLLDVWEYKNYTAGRTVDTHIKNLRNKLGILEAYPWDIVTEWGKGYRFQLKVA